MGKTLRLYLGSCMLIVLASIALLKVIDATLPATSRVGPYLFPPSQAARYRTTEFDAVATINSFGFRGAERDLKAGQIAVIGDSFTFGFGSADDETWPHLLEAGLREAGLHYQVHNLGAPGTDTLFHLRTAEAYVAALKPKYVVLSVLTADDFQQVHEALERSGWVHYAGLLQLKELAKRFLPSLHRFYTEARFPTLDGPRGSETIPIVTASWREDSLKYLSDGTRSYPPDVADRIQAGDINPGLLYLAKHYPERASSFWANLSDSGSSERTALDLIAKRLRGLKRLLDAHKGQLVIFSMPSASYVRSETHENYKKYGYVLPEETLFTREPERVLGNLAQDLEARFVPSISYFRSLDEGLFFPYDGHLTPQGNAAVAKLLRSAIVSYESDR